MDFKEFVKEIMDEMGREFPDHEVCEERVQKLQNRSYNGVVVRKKGSKIGVVLDVDEYYLRLISGCGLSEIFSDIKDVVESKLFPAEGFDPDMLKDYERLKENLMIQVVPVEGNEEMLLNIPHKIIEDIAVVYRFVLSQDENGESSILINTENLQNLGISAEQMMKDAEKVCERKYPLTVRSMESILSNVTKEMVKGLDLWVVSNENGKYGAAVIAYPNVFEKIAEKVGSGFYIIPSSIHELIVLPDNSEIKAQEIDRIIEIVNNSELVAADRLTYHSYHYDKGSGIFERAVVYEERMLEKEEAVHSLKEQATVLLVRPGRFPEIVKMGMGLSDLREAVGGCIEVIDPFNDEQACIICNEEGKIKGMRPNRAIYDKDGVLRDVIAGPFIVAGVNYDNFCSLTEEQMKKYGSQFYYPEYFGHDGKHPIVFTVKENDMKNMKNMNYMNEEEAAGNNRQRKNKKLN